MRGYKLGMRDLVHGSFLIFSLIMLSLLVSRYYLRGQGDQMALPAGSLDDMESQVDWYGIYMKEEKIGYSQTTVTRQDSQYICTDRTYMAFTMIDRPQVINSYARAVTDTSMRLVSFIFTLSGEDTDFGVRGRVDKKALNLTVTMAGQTRGETIPIDEPPQLPGTVTLLFNNREFKTGDRYTTTVFDPATLANQQLEIVVAGREKILYRGVETEVWHLRQDLAGLTVDSYLDDQGRLLEEKSQMGYRLVLEDETMARDGNWPQKGSDIQRLVAVTPDKVLPGARSMARLKVELTGVGQDTFGLRGGCQRYDNHSHVLEIVSLMPDPGRISDTLPSSVRDLNLSPTAFIQSEDTRLLTLAAQVVNLNDSPPEKVRSILRWMNGNIEKKATFSIPNTLEVLERKSGDCNEFAVLFCALARAAKIPTRVAMGLVYVEDSFYYHAWCECFMGDWIAVDPIFDQFPADATHLRFAAGDMDRQVEILPIIGRVGIKVLEQGNSPGEKR